MSSIDRFILSSVLLRRRRRRYDCCVTRVKEILDSFPAKRSADKKPATTTTATTTTASSNLTTTDIFSYLLGLLPTLAAIAPSATEHCELLVLSNQLPSSTTSTQFNEFVSLYRLTFPALDVCY
jgi:hypothetical protein